MDIRLPQLAEGVDAGTVVNILVTEGQSVKKDENVVEVETEKAVAAVPSPKAGVIRKIHVKRDDRVNVGQTIATLDEATGEAPNAGIALATQGDAEAPAIEQRERVAAERPPAQDARPSSEGPAPPGPPDVRAPSGASPAASPEIRRIVRELGIDLSRVRPTGRGGRVLMADLRAYVAGLQSVAATGEGPASAPGAARVDYARWGPIEETPLSSLRKTIADRMAASWRSVARVTQFDEADVTALLALKKARDQAFQKAGAKLTLTALLIPVVVEALKKFPVMNASLDLEGSRLVFKRYVHIGLAVDTPDGLIVPVLKNADRLSLLDGAKRIADLAARTRERKVAPDDLQGGSFTITNLGGVGGGHFTPIVYAPQAAILGVSRAAERVVLDRGRPQTRRMLPLSLAYDHRIVDGAEAVRFLRFIAGGLETYDEARFDLAAAPRAEGPGPVPAKRRRRK